jgi:hypothetical protein
MDAIHALMIAGGLALAAWNTRQRLGRTPQARAWSRSAQGSWHERAVLVVHPLIAVVLVVGGLLPLVDDSATGTVVLAVPVAVALLLLLIYLLLPLRVPGLVQPAWYRRGDRHAHHSGQA